MVRTVLRYLSCLSVSILFGFSAAANADENTDEKITFDDHVQPVFRQHCANCHNANNRSGDLDVTNYTNLMQGGSSGTVIEPGDSGGSYLYALITHEDEPSMPPESVCGPMSLWVLI